MDTHCQICGMALTGSTFRTRVRRGARFVEIEAEQLRCPSDHPDLDAGQPFYAVVTSAQGEAMKEAALQAWRDKYGEELPAPAKAGRPARTDPRRFSVHVQLTARELEAIDGVRGTTSRAEFLRRRAVG